MVFDDRLIARSALQHIGGTCSLMDRHRRRFPAVPPPADEAVLCFNLRNSDFEIAYPPRGPASPGAASPFIFETISDPNLRKVSTVQEALTKNVFLESRVFCSTFRSGYLSKVGVSPRENSVVLTIANRFDHDGFARMEVFLFNQLVQRRLELQKCALMRRNRQENATGALGSLRRLIQLRSVELRVDFARSSPALTHTEPEWSRLRYLLQLSRLRAVFQLWRFQPRSVRVPSANRFCPQRQAASLQFTQFAPALPPSPSSSRAALANSALASTCVDTATDATLLVPSANDSRVSALPMPCSQRPDRPRAPPAWPAPPRRHPADRAARVLFLPRHLERCLRRGVGRRDSGWRGRLHDALSDWRHDSALDVAMLTGAADSCPPRRMEGTAAPLAAVPLVADTAAAPPAALRPAAAAPSPPLRLERTAAPLAAVPLVAAAPPAALRPAATAARHPHRCAWRELLRRPLLCRSLLPLSPRSPPC